MTKLNTDCLKHTLRVVDTEYWSGTQKAVNWYRNSNGVWYEGPSQSGAKGKSFKVLVWADMQKMGSRQYFHIVRFIEPISE